MLHYRPYVKRYVTNIAVNSRNTSSRICAPVARSSASLSHRTFGSQAESPTKDERSGRRNGEPQQRFRIHKESEPSQSTSFSKGDTSGRNRFGSDDNAVVAPERRRYDMKYRDPLKLADDTLAKLKKDRFEEAEDLVRKSSAAIDCTVGWNHLIDWQCKKGKINSAVKSYNEMKKRGQTPDAYTYTLIFRGLAQQAHQHPSAVAHALSIYHSMDAENAPVTPNIIHTNSVLKVCAQAGDMDALFGIAAKLRDKGIRAPNNLTFTIIFNAIRDNAIKKLTTEISAEELRPLREKSVMDARRMWDDIASRWRHGDLWIDEELVCSLGRILLMGGDRDRDDIFALLRQAMNIPQLVIPHGRRVEAIEKPQESESLEEWENVKLNQARVDTSPSLASHGQFKRIVPAARKDTYGRGLSSFPRPGRNTLSLIMVALLNAKLGKQAALYWEIFTMHYNVAPDGANYHDYLRILRQARLSDEAVAVLEKMPQHMLEKKTFRLAIAACARDKQNPNAFRNATKVVDLMQETMDTIDLPTLHIYLDSAIDSDTDRNRFRESKTRQLSPESIRQMKQALLEADLAELIPSLDAKAEPVQSRESTDIGLAKFEKGKRIVAALERVSPSILNIKATLTYGVTNEARSRSKSRRDNLSVNASYQQDALKLAQRMISGYDKLMDAGMVPRDDYRTLTRERSKLTALVTKFKTKYDQDSWNKFKASSFRTWSKERPEIPATEKVADQAAENVVEQTTEPTEDQTK
ncbi:hypothetical protein V493_08415 [Pseudogymnoascus sp. VKM F-4281 (FW-2241)]|nr:hypothetical protein V493_08415 [Pseudogymnoascus sp. VKM F-4281 (FW-2241)]